MRAAAAALTAVLALCVGLYLGGHPGDLPGPIRDAFVSKQASLLSSVQQTIQDNYFRRVDQARLNDASINGMVNSLRRRFRDRFSHYLNARELEQFQEATSGRFSGVGMSVSEVKRGLRVAQVFPSSPAKRAGIGVGDLIVSVNGGSIADESADVSTAKIKGPTGTTVRLGVLRPGASRPREVRVERQEITVPVVSSRIVQLAGKSLGYVRLTSFTAGAHGELRAAAQRLEQRGAQGLVLDLRGNGGGLLEEAVLTSSIFLPRGQVVVRTASRTQGGRTYKTVGQNLPARPIVVLIDRGTASAAEILASALADDAHSTVVGTRSFGKGVFQQVIDLPNGGALDLTIGEYFTPAGTSLAGTGIRPDVAAPSRPGEQADRALRRAEAVLANQVGG